MKKEEVIQGAGLQDTTGSKKSPIKEWIILALVFVMLVLVIPNYVIQKTHVNGISMENTLHNGEYILREKVSNYISNPKRFDIVVFYSATLEEDCIKRVIGLPGETVQITAGEIYINGKVLKEDYGKVPISDSGIAAEPIVLGENEYFVLGDNREESIDSRSEAIGPITKEQMDGRAVLRIWPLNKFGIIA